MILRNKFYIILIVWLFFSYLTILHIVKICFIPYWWYTNMCNDFNLNDIVSTDVFKQLRFLKLIDETELRNLRIRNEYKLLREKFAASASIGILMDKYSLSDSSLNNILFRKRFFKLKSPMVYS